MEQGEAAALAPRPSLATMIEPPINVADREEIGNQLWIALIMRYEQIASFSDVQLLSSPPATRGRDYAVALRRFDEYILEQFGEWGWRMLMSREVMKTIARWEAEDPDRLERLGDKLALKSRIYRGEKTAPLTEGIEGFADNVIAELKILLNMQRDEFVRRAVPAKCDRIAEWMKQRVEEHPSDFPLLRANLAQLHGYVSTLPIRNKAGAAAFERSEIRADSFFYQWFAACTNRNVKDVRNQISRRRTTKLSSQK
jgi:hypothetical protein